MKSAYILYTIGLAKNTTSNISNTTNRVNDNFNAYQKTNNEILRKVLILLTNMNKKPLTQFNQSQTTLWNYKKILNTY